MCFYVCVYPMNSGSEFRGDYTMYIEGKPNRHGGSPHDLVDTERSHGQDV